ncbi:OmpA family protein [Burkholderia sp. Bp9090]|uniref:OmpA family protein n=1 Tax=Burkholderia sp. Bp9090 TaxID=2184567 RepID=UPI0039088C65
MKNAASSVFHVARRGRNALFQFAHNADLSQKRAEAVAQALATTYKIAPARLVAKGVGSLSPVASNGDDAGRAQNRRVELVQQ